VVKRAKGRGPKSQEERGEKAYKFRRIFMGEKAIPRFPRNAAGGEGDGRGKPGRKGKGVWGEASVICNHREDNITICYDGKEDLARGERKRKEKKKNSNGPWGGNYVTIVFSETQLTGKDTNTN